LLFLQYLNILPVFENLNGTYCCVSTLPFIAFDLNTFESASIRKVFKYMKQVFVTKLRIV